jgi:hypothetical protein
MVKSQINTVVTMTAATNSFLTFATIQMHSLVCFHLSLELKGVHPRALSLGLVVATAKRLALLLSTTVTSFQLNFAPAPSPSIYLNPISPRYPLLPFLTLFHPSFSRNLLPLPV